ncbi:alpha/beta fold hydrolase [Lentzea aerocolonigenes]|uniref:alpha/beta fold hydrolase n=1 Tax=Lentzea aerocolonigenes TaxID=68170 RepID=UPI0006966727|nr:alpha/beta fold hydrolase [Lentzea aerocolonigenes]
MATELSLTRLAGSEFSERVLVAGPEVGTSVVAQWRDCAMVLAGEFEVIGWDLPGHGSGGPADGPFTVQDIADQLCERVEALACGRRVAYAGASFGGAVGRELAARGECSFEAVVCLRESVPVVDVDAESYALACAALDRYRAGVAVKPLRELHDVVSPALAAVLVRVFEEMRCRTTTA